MNSLIMIFNKNDDNYKKYLNIYYYIYIYILLKMVLLVKVYSLLKLILYYNYLNNDIIIDVNFYNYLI